MKQEARARRALPMVDCHTIAMVRMAPCAMCEKAGGAVSLSARIRIGRSVWYMSLRRATKPLCKMKRLPVVTANQCELWRGGALMRHVCMAHMHESKCTSIDSTRRI